MSAEEFLEGAMTLPPRERWQLGMWLLESLEVVDPARADSGDPSNKAST